MLLVGTRKGLFLVRGDRISKPAFLGSTVFHAVARGRTILAAVGGGHLGPTVQRSTDRGRTWKEAARPPAFPKESGDSIKHVFWLTAARAAGLWYAGTAPHGIFRSKDDGRTWEGVRGFNEHPLRPQIRGLSEQGPPDSPNTHSILEDPRDPRHLYVAFSAGGVFESIDSGADWKPLNKGVAADFMPDPNAEFGHDPHCVRMHPRNPDRLYQQNHCGLYRLDRPGNAWTRIGRNLPAKIGDIGFPVVLHPRDPETLWVIPMDGTQAWPRTSPGGRPAVYVSRDGGRTFQRLDKGFPRRDAWWTVKRQAFTAIPGKPVGLAFGTMGGQLWTSRDEGRSWRIVTRDLPSIVSVECS